MSLLDDDGQAFLEANAEIINEKGNFDFFKYLNLMKDTSSSFTPESIEFINNSYLFKELPKDIFEAEEEFNILEPINLINVAQKRYLSDESSESYKLFERLKNTETPGIDVAKDDEELPSSFKNSEGQIDLYLALN